MTQIQHSAFQSSHVPKPAQKVKSLLGGRAYRLEGGLQMLENVMVLGTTNKLQDKLSLPPVWFNIQQLTSYEYDDTFRHLIGALKFEGGPAPCGMKMGPFLYVRDKTLGSNPSF